ncbi:2-aminoethanethiol dioxygenase [Phymastichus coffea]|uniref:2-aminoethanethiol dioxygenase n=1 Tax=Phymastichus coffea TaxID=108790 RepID=UPI00273BEA16|nr:2-aminoethanethiol dioxygenase [Phymastichus coffea]XP_058803647.1 2-aminoethanethiol dioxygenase [Phymastichus coffea]XP_058803648.1 2-aminoethanethiol dioxygenase [Phymastichus coffea]
MATKIEVLWKQALKMFSGRNNPNYNLCLKNLEKLKSLINDITAEDVHVDKNVFEYIRIQSAPMCVIDVFENEDITIAIFILKTGVTLPMHDHPEMHGLLKVINGVVKIDSYTIESPNSTIEINQRIPATRHPSMIIGTTDPACVLTPDKRNLHEITCIEGPAAFLDILSPPYDTDEYGDGKRPCRYFKCISNEMTEQVQLMIADVPSSFYSRTIKYLGKPLR